MKIVVFDSGVGGFSILKHLLVYQVNIHYLADQAYFPYGDKQVGVLAKRLSLLSTWLKRNSPDLVVLACNTATVSGIKYLRSLLPCPVVGVEPVVKPASNYQRSLILGTKVTLESHRLQTLLLAHPTRILTYHPSGLAQAIENIDFVRMKNIIHKIKSVVQKQQIEAVGLSCTHYPLIKDLLEAELPSVAILDPSLAVANHVLNKLSKRSRKLDTKFYTTGDVLRFNYQISHYLGLSVQSRKVVI